LLQIEWRLTSTATEQFLKNACSQPEIQTTTIADFIQKQKEKDVYKTPRAFLL
jgi:hypothetical protein